MVGFFCQLKFPAKILEGLCIQQELQFGDEEYQQFTSLKYKYQGMHKVTHK